MPLAARAPLRVVVVLVRSLPLAAAGTAVLLGLLALVAEAFTDVLARVRTGGGWTNLPLEVMVESLAAFFLAACGLWLLVVAVGAAVEAVTGASSAALRAISPRVVRRVVLVACGIAVGGTTLVAPATAAEQHRPGDDAAPPAVAALDGLPLPDRAVGETAAPSPRLMPVAAVHPAKPRYVVRPGDSLWSIATRLSPGASPGRVDALWRLIHRANRDVIGPDPDLILPGTTLRLPELGKLVASHHRKDPS